MGTTLRGDGRVPSLAEVARLVSEFVALSRRRQEAPLAEPDERRWVELKQELQEAQRQEQTQQRPR